MSLAARRKGLIALSVIGLLASFGAHADEPASSPSDESPTFVHRVVDQAAGSVASVQEVLAKALDLVCIRYRRGGNRFDAARMGEWSS